MTVYILSRTIGLSGVSGARYRMILCSSIVGALVVVVLEERFKVVVMPESSSIEQVVLAAYAGLVKQIEDIDDAMQKEFGIPSTFDIRKFGPEDYAYAEQREHKPGEKIPCRICIAEALQQAQGELAMETQAQQQGAQVGS